MVNSEVGKQSSDKSSIKAMFVQVLLNSWTMHHIFRVFKEVFCSHMVQLAIFWVLLFDLFLLPDLIMTSTIPVTFYCFKLLFEPWKWVPENILLSSYPLLLLCGCQWFSFSALEEPIAADCWNKIREVFFHDLLNLLWNLKFFLFLILNINFNIHNSNHTRPHMCFISEMEFLAVAFVNMQVSLARTGSVLKVQQPTTDPSSFYISLYNEQVWQL